MMENGKTDLWYQGKYAQNILNQHKMCDRSRLMLLVNTTWGSTYLTCQLYVCEFSLLYFKSHPLDTFHNRFWYISWGSCRQGWKIRGWSLFMAGVVTDKGWGSGVVIKQHNTVSRGVVKTHHLEMRDGALRAQAIFTRVILLIARNKSWSGGVLSYLGIVERFCCDEPNFVISDLIGLLFYTLSQFDLPPLSAEIINLSLSHLLP